jgi:hypothetical protein
MKYAIEVGSSAMIHIPSFITIGSGIQELMAGGGGGGLKRHTDSKVIS